MQRCRCIIFAFRAVGAGGVQRCRLTGRFEDGALRKKLLLLLELWVLTSRYLRKPEKMDENFQVTMAMQMNV